MREMTADFKEIKKALETKFQCKVTSHHALISVEFQNKEDSEWFHHFICQLKEEESPIETLYYVQPIGDPENSPTKYEILFKIKDKDKLIKQIIILRDILDKIKYISKTTKKEYKTIF